MQQATKPFLIQFLLKELAVILQKKNHAAEYKYGKCTDKINIMFHKVLSYNVIHVSLHFIPSVVWLLGKHNRFYSVRAIYVHCCIIIWESFHS
jgi:predicted histidine transporter YuiF (NhaC family)